MSCRSESCMHLNTVAIKRRDVPCVMRLPLCTSRVCSPVSAKAIFLGKNMSDFEALLQMHVDKQTLSRKRRAITGVRCEKNCADRMLCPDSHGDKIDDLEHCLCEAWWCPKSHPNRSNTFNRAGVSMFDEGGFGVLSLHERQKPPKDYVCKRCKSTEHYLNRCPQNVCTYCQDIGHIATSCPHNLERWQNLERNVKARRM